MHVKQKQTGKSKGQTCADGRPMRATTKPEDAASPATFLESVLLTAVTEAEERCDVMMADMPNAFVQTELEKHLGQKKIIMKLHGAVAKMMTQCAPKICKPCIVFENGQKAMHVELLKASCGSLMSAPLFHKKSLKDLTLQGFELNPCNPCVVNKMMSGKQMTVVWHVDDLKKSHVNKRVNNKFLEWLKSKCEDKEIGIVKAT